MHTGWNFFFSLLLAVIVAGVIGNVTDLGGWTPWWIGLIIFVILAVFLSIYEFVHNKKKKSEMKKGGMNESEKK